MAEKIESGYRDKTGKTEPANPAANDWPRTPSAGISLYPQELEYDSLGQRDDTDSMGQSAKSAGMPSDDELRWIK